MNSLSHREKVDLLRGRDEQEIEKLINKGLILTCDDVMYCQFLEYKWFKMFNIKIMDIYNRWQEKAKLFFDRHHQEIIDEILKYNQPCHMNIVFFLLSSKSSMDPQELIELLNLCEKDSQVLTKIFKYCVNSRYNCVDILLKKYINDMEIDICLDFSISYLLLDIAQLLVDNGAVIYGYWDFKEKITREGYLEIIDFLMKNIKNVDKLYQIYLEYIGFQLDVEYSPILFNSLFTSKICELVGSCSRVQNDLLKIE